MINRTPTSVLQGKCPYEVLFGKNPYHDHLRVFGSLYYVTIVRAVKGVFLGYPYTKKGYKVLNLDTKHVFVSHDVHLKLCFRSNI